MDKAHADRASGPAGGSEHGPAQSCSHGDRAAGTVTVPSAADAAGGGQTAIRPPSTARIAPGTNRALSPAR